MWNKCGMSRNEKGLKEAISEIKALREEFWKNVKVPGNDRRIEPRTGKGRSRRRFP